MSCITLYKGQDSTCATYAKKYYQQVVLINKAHVKDYDINVGFSDVTTDDRIIYNRIRFNLKDGKKGILFRGNERGDSFNATWEKEDDNFIPQYIHIVQLPIFGVTEDTKIILKSLDVTEYFAAVQYHDGTVEIYGFENGLKTDKYSFEPQGNDGGSVIELASSEFGLEDNPPYIYKPLSGSASDDFDDLFELWFD